MKKGINVISLFDGMSCGQLALKKIGVKINNYYAAEIDKFAIKEVKENFPNTQHLGDVTNFKNWDLDWASIDILMGGSPCQGFSFAGKQLAFDDPRSELFFVYVDILNHIREHNPNIKFMLENVRMKKEYLDIISEHLGVEPLLINSALVSAQSRNRYYWANWSFDLPSDKGLVLADIIDDHEFEHISNSNYLQGYFCNDKRIDRVRDIKDKKALTLSSTTYKGQINSYIKTTVKCNQVAETTDTGNFQIDKRVYGVGGKSPALRRLGKPPKLQVKESAYECLKDVHYRKLTVRECCRLQTVPDDYFKVSSKTQSYKMLGNGWTVDVIVHIFNNLFFNK